MKGKELREVLEREMSDNLKKEKLDEIERKFVEKYYHRLDLINIRIATAILEPLGVPSIYVDQVAFIIDAHFGQQKVEKIEEKKIIISH